MQFSSLSKDLTKECNMALRYQTLRLSQVQQLKTYLSYFITCTCINVTNHVDAILLEKHGNKVSLWSIVKTIYLIMSAGNIHEANLG